MHLEKPEPKPLKWLGSSKDDLKEFPDLVRKEMGHALYLAHGRNQGEERIGLAIAAGPEIAHGGRVLGKNIGQPGDRYRHGCHHGSDVFFKAWGPHHYRG